MNGGAPDHPGTRAGDPSVPGAQDGVPDTARDAVPMDSGEREARRLAFDAVAEAYDDARPGYPEVVIDEAVRLASLRPGERVLEIGCGTGQATRPFAERGLRIVALEPSPRMAQLARRRLAHLGTVDVVTEAFEEHSDTGPYDALLAATSFHWLDPATRVASCAALLGPAGRLILMSNVHPRPFEGFFERVQEAYRAVVPGWGKPGNRPKMDDEMTRAVRQVAHSDRFEEVHTHTFDWSRSFTTTQYIRLLDTFSDHRMLPGPVRRSLYERIGEIIDRDYGGQVERPYRTLLAVARRG